MEFYDALANIILGVTGNALYSLTLQMSQKVGEAIASKDTIEKLQLDKTSLDPLLRQAVDAIAEIVEWDGPAGTEKISLFLSTPEVQTIIRQVYSASLLEDREPLTLPTIQQSFLSAFALYLGIEQEEIAPASQHLFNALIYSCEHTLSNAINKGILSAHEARSNLRYRILLDEVSAVRSTLSILTAQQQSNITQIYKFEQRYRQQVGNRHKDIVPPYLDGAKRILLDKLYVSPTFTSDETNNTKKYLSMSNVLSSMYRIVVLGNPGGGKSTFALKLCYDLATQYEKQIYARKEVTPILVILREYGEHKKQNNSSILEYIESTAKSTYQITPPPGAFEYLLSTGRAIVIFDGLDELLDTTYRQTITKDVELFCDLYHSVPVVVTSRSVGYDDAPLDEYRFQVFSIAPFNNQQVEKYVSQWFSCIKDLSVNQRKDMTKSFLAESTDVEDLRTNPLMLGLMCNIYRNENYIPKNRPDVYEACAEMLFNRWDKRRGIRVSLSLPESFIRPTMAYLAYWIYSTQGTVAGVTESALVVEAANYLLPRRFESLPEAEAAALEFISFCRGRAWVFTDVGTNRLGERLYQFTHRTFLEYFTALHLTYTQSTSTQLLRVLLPKIATGSWDVVAQLTFQIKSKSIDASDELLRYLVGYSNKYPQKKLEIMYFSARCLGFLIPSPKTVQLVVTEIMECIMDWAINVPDDVEKITFQQLAIIKKHSPYTDMMSALIGCNIEVRKFVDEVIFRSITNHIKGSNDYRSSTALNIARSIAVFYDEPQESTQGIEEFAEALSEKIINDCIEDAKRLMYSDFNICQHLYFNGSVTLRELTDIHGISALFWPALYKFSSTFASAIAYGLLRSLFVDGSNDKNRIFEIIKEIGSIFLSQNIPIKIYMNYSIGSHFNTEMTDGIIDSSYIMKNSNTVFGLFVLIATYFEIERNRMLAIDFDDSQVHMVIRLVNARYTQDYEIEEILEILQFNSDQQRFVRHWIRGELIQFIK